MSTLATVGIAASIIQVADLGTKLSVKLFSLYRQIANASQTIQNLSSDVALTCALLRELGETLRTDEQSKLCSKESFQNLESLISQCRAVLGQIQEAISYTDGTGKTRLQQVTEQFRVMLLGPSLDPLKSNLERLKSTMVLLLNVIIYASQVRSNNVPALLQEQRELIESLLDEKGKNDKGAYLDVDDVNKSTEWKAFDSLIRKMLEEVDLFKCRLEKRRHSRIKDGVRNIHSGEIVRFCAANNLQIKFDSTLLRHKSDDGFLNAQIPLKPISPSRHEKEGADGALVSKGISDVYDSDDAMKLSPQLPLKIRYEPEESLPPFVAPMNGAEKNDKGPPDRSSKPHAAMLYGSDDDTLSLGLEAQRPNYGPYISEPPPFEIDSPRGSGTKNAAGTGPERLRKKYPDETREGDLALLRVMDPNRVDIAAFERDHPLGKELLSDVEFGRKRNQERLIPKPPEDSRVDLSENATYALSLLKESPDHRVFKNRSPPVRELARKAELTSPKRPRILSVDTTYSTIRHQERFQITASESKLPALEPYPTPTKQVAPTSGERASLCSGPSTNGVPPFQTESLLNSHVSIHSQDRHYFCPVEGCPRSVGGKGFKRKLEMIRHGLVHNSPGYVCPFCPDQQRKYPRPDNLQRHVRVNHVDKSKDDPILRQVLAQRPVSTWRGRRRRLTQGQLSFDSNRVERAPVALACQGPLVEVAFQSIPTNFESLLLRWTTLQSHEIRHFTAAM